MTIRPIRNDDDLKEALKRLRKLWGSPADSPEADEFDVLAVLIEDYERRHHPIPPPDPVEAIRFFMEDRGLKPKDLIPYLGASSRVAEILNRKRRLTLEMIRKLHHGLGIPLQCLVGEIEAKAS